MNRYSNFLVAPDCLLILGLALVLTSFGKKRNLEFLKLWTSALLVIVAEDIAFMFYSTPLSPLLHEISHACALVAYYLVGLAFFWTASGSLRLIQHSKIYIVLCAAPQLLILIAYGMDFHAQSLFLAFTISGFVIGILASLLLHRPRTHLLAQVAIWLPSIWFAYVGHFRHVAYYSLFGIYAATAIGFYFTLPRKRWGRIIVITGFAVWSICFLTHPWIRDRFQDWASLANRVWDLESFVVCIGLLILTLEELSAIHESDALHDALTGLPNRRLFAEKVKQAVARASRNKSRLALVNIDLNQFKLVNDTWGHDTGDFLLREVATRLRSVTRETDTLCRIGGDEFYLLVEDFDLHGASASGDFQFQGLWFLAQLRQRVETDPFVYRAPGREVRFSTSLSLGLAVYPDQATSENELHRIADRSMYEDKRNWYASNLRQNQPVEQD
jgi:diguanylate cyclase (GGDEF)-like protein